jgi:hypothetical protein
MRLNHSGEAYFPAQWELEGTATKSPVKQRAPPNPKSEGGTSGSDNDDDGARSLPSPTRGGRGIFHGWRGRFGWRRNQAVEVEVDTGGGGGDGKWLSVP